MLKEVRRWLDEDIWNYFQSGYRLLDLMRRIVGMKGRFGLLELSKENDTAFNKGVWCSTIVAIDPIQ